MPSNEWFENNPKVSAYIPKDLNQRLEEWMSTRGIKKVSQALTTILEEFLGGVQAAAPQSSDDTRDRLALVEEKVATLTEQLANLTQAIAVNQLMGSSPTVNQSSSMDELPLIKAIVENQPIEPELPPEEPQPAAEDQPQEVSPTVDESSLPEEPSDTSHDPVTGIMSERQLGILTGIHRNKLSKQREAPLEFAIEGKSYKATYHEKVEGKARGQWAVEPAN